VTDRRISVRERVQALQRLEALAFEVNQISAWLAGAGIETESDMLDQAAKAVLASCWLLSRPVRAQLPPERWQQAPDGYSPR
jgi:hypothetical protein